jgi:hypothetical protein
MAISSPTLALTLTQGNRAPTPPPPPPRRLIPPVPPNPTRGTGGSGRKKSVVEVIAPVMERLADTLKAQTKSSYEKAIEKFNGLPRTKNMPFSTKRKFYNYLKDDKNSIEFLSIVDTNDNDELIDEIISDDNNN